MVSEISLENYVEVTLLNILLTFEGHLRQQTKTVCYYQSCNITSMCTQLISDHQWLWVRINEAVCHKITICITCARHYNLEEYILI